MTREEIERTYGVNENGVILAHGKFEAEMVYAPYFYDLAMNVGATEDTEVDGIPVYYFDIQDEDIAEFPELDGVLRIGIWEDDSGFVHCQNASEEPAITDEEGDDDGL